MTTGQQHDGVRARPDGRGVHCARPVGNSQMPDGPKHLPLDSFRNAPHAAFIERCDGAQAPGAVTVAMAANATASCRSVIVLRPPLFPVSRAIRAAGAFGIAGLFTALRSQRRRKRVLLAARGPPSRISHDLQREPAIG